MLMNLMCEAVDSKALVLTLLYVSFVALARFLPERNMVRVMHSMHASFAELQAFVAYLQPESIVPCVIPSSLGDSSLTDLHVRWVVL